MSQRDDPKSGEAFQEGSLVPGKGSGSEPEYLPVTGELYSDITLEELEERLELQALLDGDLGADFCYSRCSQQCTEQSGTIISSSETTIISTITSTVPGDSGP